MSMSEQDKNRIFGRIGLIIGLIVGILMPVVVVLHHNKGLYSSLYSNPVAVILLLVITGGVVWGFIKLYFHPTFTGKPENAALLQNGVPAVARVVQKSDTGWSVNTQLKIELLLVVQLQVENCPAYQTKIKTLIPRLQPDLYDPGTVLEVRVDPKKLKRIAIVGIMNT